MTSAIAAGDEPTAEELNLLFATGQCVARAIRTTGSSAANSTTDVPVLRLDDIPGKGGRLYIVAYVCSPNASTATDVIRTQIRFDFTGADATTSNAILPGSRSEVTDGGAPGVAMVMAPWTHAVDHSLSVLLCVANANGSSNANLVAEATGRATGLYVFDCGVDPGDTGVAP